MQFRAGECVGRRQNSKTVKHFKDYTNNILSKAWLLATKSRRSIQNSINQPRNILQARIGGDEEFVDCLFTGPLMGMKGVWIACEMQEK